MSVFRGDRESANVEAAERLAMELELPEPSGFDPNDDATLWGERAERLAPWQGVCGGCGGWATSRSREGACLWKGGVWHPECRRRDRGELAAAA